MGMFVFRVPQEKPSAFPSVAPAHFPARQKTFDVSFAKGTESTEELPKRLARGFVLSIGLRTS